MTDGSESPRDVITRMVLGCRNTQALYVVAKLGVADQLVRGGLQSGELARRLGVQPQPLFRVMRALAEQGIFTQDKSDRFGLTPFSELLRDDNPNSLRYVAINVGEEYYRSAGELLHTVRTGETAFNHIYGKGQFEYLAENPEANRTFNLFMAQGLRGSGNPLGLYDFGERSVVVDVGGGNGTMIASILEANPHLNGVLYDLPQVVAEASKVLESHGIQDRCRVVAGSFFRSVPPGGDTYILSRILHDWPDEKAKEILANCRRAMEDDGVLIIREAVIPEGDAPSQGKQVDLTMLFMLGGRERTQHEWKELLKESKFDLTRVIETGKSFDLIEAKPA